MGAEIIARGPESFKVMIEIPYGKSMMEFEASILAAINEGGVLATGEALKQFDTDGAPIVVGDVKFTAKEKRPRSTRAPTGKCKSSGTSTRPRRAGGSIVRSKPAPGS